MAARRALVREVPLSFASGVTTSSLGPPDVELARRQHEAYVASLRQAGLEVIVLPADESLPDSCFVEDTAVVLNREELVMALPGHPARVAEVEAVEQALTPFFTRVRRIEPPGTLDGGDVLRLDTSLVVGLSGRTNRDGAVQLQPWACLPVGEGLHLKSSSAYLGDGMVLAIESLAGTYRQLGLRVVVVPDEERYAANVLRSGRQVWVAAGFPQTAELLSEEGFTVTALDVSEFRKQDGGLTCLSILY